MNQEYIKISELNNYIKSLLDKDHFLNKIYLKGEISNFKNHTRGHLYFTLKDDTSRISAVMFQSSAVKLTFTPEDGMNVLVEGRISAYPAQGTYQIYVDKMEPDGLGALYIEYEKLKKKLSEKDKKNHVKKNSDTEFFKKLSKNSKNLRIIKNKVKRDFIIFRRIKS